MKLVPQPFSPEFTEALGWTIVHSFWQASAIALGLGLLLLILRRRSAQIKYFISFAALIGVLAWSVITFVQSYHYAVEKQVVKEKLIHQPDFVKSLLKPTVTDQISSETAVSTVDLRLVRTRAFFQRNFNWICLVWISGLVILMVRLMGGYVYTRRLRSYQLMPLPEGWLDRITAMAVKMGIRRKVQAFCSPLTLVPMTLGTIKPIVLFPVTAFTGLSASELEAIAAHELAHVLRNDYLFNIIQSIVEILFFYHPAVWIISGQIRAERENSCDNLAIAATGDKVSYIKALAAMQFRHFQAEPQLSMAFSVQRNSVLTRIKRIQKLVNMKTNLNEGLIAAAVIVIGLALASFTIGQNDMKVSLKDEQKAELVPLNKAKTDSVRTRFERMVSTADNDRKEELQKVAEVAYSEKDTLKYAEMMKEIDRAMQEIDVEQIVKEAMQSAQEAMKDASVEIEKAYREIDREQLKKELEAARENIDREQIKREMANARRDIEAAGRDIDREELKREMEEARKEIEAARKEMEQEMQRDMESEGIDRATREAAIQAASAGLDAAAAAVGNLDIEAITNAALAGTAKALEALEKINVDSLINLQQLPTETQLIEIQEQLEEQQKQLKQQQKQIKKELKEIKKEN